MKIKECFPELINKIYLEKTHRGTERSRFSALARLEEKAVFFEKLTALNELEKLFYTHEEQEVTVATLQSFKRFLASRWRIIANSNLAYPYSVKYSITQLCLYIAEQMAPVFQVHPFQLLMPTLEVRNQVSLTTLEEDDAEAIQNNKPILQLSSVILSDDNTHLIHVLDCLRYAKEDKVLKHTHQLHEDKRKLLSESESQRVISHSFESQQFYDALIKQYTVKVDGQNTGGFIRRLINRLRVAGERGGRDGTADFVGRDGVAGIKEFYLFLNTFTQDEKKQLFACFSTFNTVAMTFELCWVHLLSRIVLEGKLAVPEKELHNMVALLTLNPTLSVPCIELIADDLERILSNHQELFLLFPQNRENAQEIGLSMCRERVEETEGLLVDYLESGKNKVLERYDDKAIDNFIKRIFKEMIVNIESLKRVMESIPISLCRSLLHDHLGQAFLHKLVKDVASLQLFITEFKEDSLQSIVLEAVGEVHLKKVVMDFTVLSVLLKQLEPAQYLSLLFDHLGADHLNTLLVTPEITRQFWEMIPKSFHQVVEKKWQSSKDRGAKELVAPSFSANRFFVLPPARRLAAMQLSEDELEELSNFHL